MKRIIYFILAILVCGIYAGCSENEIDLYDHLVSISMEVCISAHWLIQTM